MTSHRAERVADMLRRELSQILHDEVRDPRIRDASVSRVEVSGDLQHARVLVSVLGGREAQDDCLEGLRRAGGFVRRQLASRINLRSVPELRFAIDHGAEHSVRITQLLEELNTDSNAEREVAGDDAGPPAGLSPEESDP